MQSETHPRENIMLLLMFFFCLNVDCGFAVDSAHEVVDPAKFDIDNPC